LWLAAPYAQLAITDIVTTSEQRLQGCQECHPLQANELEALLAGRHGVGDGELFRALRDLQRKHFRRRRPLHDAARSAACPGAARTFGVDLLVLKAGNWHEIDASFAALVQQQAGALLINSDVFYVFRTDQLVALAARHAIPTSYAFLEQGAVGGLMCYGADLAATQHTVGVYTGRILKGEKPGDLPVEQVTKLQLVINMKTAKALGLTVPLLLLGRADKVIE
jgi:hypothetical protein